MYCGTTTLGLHGACLSLAVYLLQYQMLLFYIIIVLSSKTKYRLPYRTAFVLCCPAGAGNVTEDRQTFVVAFIENRMLTTLPVCRLYLTPIDGNRSVKVNVSVPLRHSVRDESLVLMPDKTHVVEYPDTMYMRLSRLSGNTCESLQNHSCSSM